MSRLVLALLLLFLAGLLVPSLRERVQPQIDESRLWLGEKLEGPMTPLLTPYRRLKTQAQIDDALREMIQDRNTGYPPPVVTDFREYLIRNQIEPLDGWGAPLVLEREADSLMVMSPGPDMNYGTDDDMRSKIQYRERGRRR